MTYLPPHFEETDPAALHALVRAHPLGTWVLSHQGELRAHPLGTWVLSHQGELLVNHIPFLLDPQRGEHGTLVAHVARANPVWQALAAGPTSVVVFTGPQAYVSPNWYPSKREHGKAVPTWNYAVVHAHGVPRAFDDPARVLEVVTRLTQIHEANQVQPWQVTDAPADYLQSMLKAIVGIEIPVQRWVGKRKTSQNRSPADRLGVVAGLTALGTPQASDMAALVQAHGSAKDKP